jgi:OmpA-OmpF porin, OOP family
MKRALMVAFGLFLGLAGFGTASADADLKGSKDHPLLSRMNGFHISGYEERDFDTYKFIGKSGKPVPVEGRYFFLEYRPDKGVTSPGELKIRRNIQEALKKVGGEVVFDDNFNRVSTIVLRKDNRETWITVRSGPHLYRLWIVEKKAMEQEVVANADAMSDEINATGHAAVYGIYFDTGLSVIKPESDATIAEIAKLLTNSATLKLDVVGHTDNVGSLDANMKLSRERADAVVKTLVDKHRVAGARLRANGVASLCPVISNDTAEGRARNRRVELVKQ